MFLFFVDEVFSTNSQSSLKRLRTNRQNEKLLRGPNLVQGGVGRNEAISPTGPSLQGFILSLRDKEVFIRSKPIKFWCLQASTRQSPRQPLPYRSPVRG